MSNILDVHTENDQQYQFYPVSTGSIRFEVKTAKDAHIVLTNGPKDTEPMYEVIIGGWNNSKSVIRKNKNKTDQAEASTPGIHNENEFHRFWIRWDGDKVQVGRDNESIPFVTYTDLEPFPITFIGVGTGWGASGIWKFEDGTEIFTPDSGEQLEYKFAPVKTGYLEFEYRGPHNAQISLSSGPGEKDPMYEIVLGGQENTNSVIRCRRETSEEVILSTPGLLDPMKFKKFLIDWTNSRLTVRDGTNTILMDWQNIDSFPVTHFGLRTRNKARGHWRIHRFWTGPSFLRAGSGKA